jgi:hypothetical protein
MNSPSPITRAGQVGFQRQPELLHYDPQAGGSQEDIYKGPSNQLADFVGQMAGSGARVRSLFNDGLFATVSVSWPTWQDGSSNVTTDLPDGVWSISPGGQTQHIFKDARFAALASEAEKYDLNKFRTDPTAPVDNIVSANGLEFLRCLRDQKDTQESKGWTLTRRTTVPDGWNGTLDDADVGTVYEDNAALQAAAGVPASYMGRFSVDYQWLVRPFTMEQQRGAGSVIVLPFWGAPSWDEFLFPTRV